MSASLLQIRIALKPSQPTHSNTCALYFVGLVRALRCGRSRSLTEYCCCTHYKKDSRTHDQLLQHALRHCLLYLHARSRPQTTHLRPPAKTLERRPKTNKQTNKQTAVAADMMRTICSMRYAISHVCARHVRPPRAGTRKPAAVVFACDRR